MSRIGRMPVVVPEGVEVKIDGSQVWMKGPKGELKRDFRPEMSINFKEGVITVERPSDEPQMRAFHGLTRALLNNMVVGVSEGFEKTLQIEGVGYRPEKQGENLVLHLGFSHLVNVPPPSGINFDVDTRARLIKVQGIDKELVGRVAADIRKIRPPEPYKGKGIRYLGEHVRRKAGKAGKVT
ncbi:MAG: 50S ribosomal protein L6 [Anaerolineaceae bacterium]|nr:MAG: 50S ribosomal protein L6 [Anaerolineaceae bacterium]